MRRASSGPRRADAPLRRRVRRIVTAVPAAMLAVVLASCRTSPATSGPDASATFVVVRHAEKAADDPRDPSLLPAGTARAQRLATMLRDAPLRAVFATPFRRTQQTAAPTARSHDLPIQVYDPAEPAAALARRLRDSHRDGTVLVVGHSNTAPALAAALCGCAVAPMPETEYGRHYRLTVEGDGPARLEVIAW